MLYQLESATALDQKQLIKYKLSSILMYAKDITQEEKNEITQYVTCHILKQIKDYKMIKLDNKTIGCLLIEKQKDGVLLDEIFIEKEYRNHKIGTRIIKNVILNHPTIYLWVYKNNINACRLYKKLGFIIIEETKTRYFMKFSKIK